MTHLWALRFSAFINDRIFLLRRLANGFAFLPVLIFLFGLYYYPQFIDWLPLNFPVKLTLSIIIAWFVTRVSFRSFLKMEDIVYLIPKEIGMNTYFRKCYYYNVIIQGFSIFTVLVLLSPLYFARVSSSLTDFIVLTLIFIVLKAWNVFVFWQALNIESILLRILQFGINLMFIYGLLLKITPLFVIAVFLMAILYWGIQKYKKTMRVDWLRLIEHEQRLDARFYAWISSFVDHPYILSKISHRKLLAKATRLVSKKSEYSYHYIFIILFIRTDIFGIVLRILLIGLILLWILPNTYFIFATYIALLIVIGLQIHSFWHTFSNRFWANLYPLTNINQRQAFLSCSFIVMLLTAYLLFIPILIMSTSIKIIIMYSLIAIIVPYSFIYFYVNKKIRV